MADYGLKISNTTGAIILDVGDKITRLRYSSGVSAGASGSTVLNDISGASSAEFGLAIMTSPSTSAVAHDVSRSGTTISWTAKSGTKYSSSDTAIFTFLYT